MEPLDILFWSLVGSLVVVALDPWSWRSSKPVPLQQKTCRYYRCDK